MHIESAHMGNSVNRGVVKGIPTGEGEIINSQGYFG